MLFLGSCSQKKERNSYIEIKSPNDAIDIFSHLEFLEEEGNPEFDLHGLSSKPFAIPEKLDYYIDAERKEEKTVWMRCTLVNRTPEDLTYYYILRHAYSHLSTVFVNGEKLHTYNYKKIDKKFRYSNYPTWKILIPKSSEVELYIKVYETGGRIRVSGLLKEEKQFLDYRSISFATHGAFIIFILLVVFFAVYISRYTKQYYVLFYSLYVLFLGVDYLAVNGIGQSYLWRETEFLLLSARSMSNAASAMFLSLFFVQFYDQFKYPIWVKSTFKLIAIIFGIFLILYGVKIFTKGFSSLFWYVWRTIELFAIVLIIIHLYLGVKKTIPLYLPLVFIIHTAITFYNSKYIFPYNDHFILDWILMNIYYISLGLEVFVLTYFIFSRLRKEKLYISELEIEVAQLQEKLDELKNRTQDVSIVNELIHLKSKAVINSVDILYIKSDGHYVEYHLENKNTPEVDRNSLTEVLQQLPSSSFIRTHKSYIVNIYRIKIINSTKLMLDNGIWLNLSRTYKKQLKEILHHGG